MGADYRRAPRIGRLSTLVLARKYRPRNFAQMAGQEHVVRALRNAIEQRRLNEGLRVEEALGEIARFAGWPPRRHRRYLTGTLATTCVPWAALCRHK